MKKIYREPRTGKTTDLIEMCANLGGHIVCMDKIRAEQTFEMARDFGFNIPYPITFDEFLSGKYKGVKKFYIDNADQLLKKLAKGVWVEAIVMDDTTKWDKMYN